MTEAPTELLSRMAILTGLDEDARRAIWAAGRDRRIPDGAAIVTELEAGDQVYLLLEGRVEITVGSGGGAPCSHLAWLEPGSAIGEVAAFTGELRSAKTGSQRTRRPPSSRSRLEWPIQVTRRPAGGSRSAAGSSGTTGSGRGGTRSRRSKRNRVRIRPWPSPDGKSRVSTALWNRWPAKAGERRMRSRRASARARASSSAVVRATSDDGPPVTRWPA